MDIRNLSYGVVNNLKGPNGTQKQIDVATVEAVYQIVLLVIERINACMPEATDEEIQRMIQHPSPLQKVIFGNLVKKYLKALFADLGQELIQAILDFVNDLSLDDIGALRNDALYR